MTPWASRQISGGELPGRKADLREQRVFSPLYSSKPSRTRAINRYELRVFEQRSYPGTRCPLHVTPQITVERVRIDVQRIRPANADGALLSDEIERSLERLPGEPSRSTLPAEQHYDASLVQRLNLERRLPHRCM